MGKNNDCTSLGKVVQITGAPDAGPTRRVGPRTVEEILNAMLDAEADAMCGGRSVTNAAQTG